MTAAELAERYLREAARDCGPLPWPIILAAALHAACEDLAAERPRGFDRSETLARARTNQKAATAPAHL